MNDRRYWLEQHLLACCYALTGLSVAALIVLRATDPRRVARPVTR
jgi:hypothetical protein